MTAALVLGLSPASASAAITEPPEAEAEQPEAEAERSWDDPVDIEPPPERELSPEPPQEPEEGPVEGPEAEDETTDELAVVVEEPQPPEDPARAERLRKAGIGLLASGGLIATTGLGLTTAYTILGDKRGEVADPVLAEIERANKVASVGGVLLASGLAVAAVGGVIFIQARQAKARSVARVRVLPALGGVVLSGRF